MSEPQRTVASLDDDHALQVDKEPSKGAITEEELYALGVEILKKGPDKRKFLRTFSQRTGKSQMELRDLAERIWQENSQTRRTNSLIIVGVGAVLLLGGLFAGFQLEVSPVLTGLPIVFGLYFFGLGLYMLYQVGRE